MIKNLFKKVIQFIKANPMTLVLPLLYFFPEYFGEFGFLFIGAIAFDNSTIDEETTDEQTFAHINTGSDLVLFVGVLCSSGDDITGVTYNGVAMTQLVKVDSSIPGRFRYIYGLLNPATGSNNVVVSASGSTSLISIASSYTGVDQGQTLTDITDTTQSGATAPTTMNMTSTVDNSWGVMMIRSDNNNLSASTNANEVEKSGAGDGNRTALYDTGGAITPAGAYTMVVNHNTNGNTGACSVTFAPSIAPITIPVTKSLKYTIKKAIGITKSLNYEVLSDVAVTKSLKYTIPTTPSAKTRSLKYTVTTTPSAETRSLEYQIESETAVTKSLKYTVMTTPSAETRSLEYQIFLQTNEQRGLEYQVITNTNEQRGLEYEVVKWFQPAILTPTVGSITSGILSDVYVQDAVLLTLAEVNGVDPAFVYDFDFFGVANGGEEYTAHFNARYTGSASHRIKLQQWNFNTLAWDDVTSNTSDFPYNATIQTYSYVLLNTVDHISGGNIRLRICHCQGTGNPAHTFVIDKFILEFHRHFTRDLKYTINSPVGVIKSLKYTVGPITQTPIEKTLEYQIVSSPTAPTRAILYKMKPSVSETRGLIYDVITDTAIQKSLEYSVMTETAVTKSLKYTVKSAVGITKQLMYQLTTAPVDITKSLKYSVITTPAEKTRSLNYEVVVETPITKSLKYCVPETISITKGLIYSVIKEMSTTKSLAYNVGAGITITKSLQYEVTAEVSVTKALTYEIRGFPYSYGDIPAYKPFY